MTNPMNAPWTAQEIAPGIWTVRGENKSLLATGLTEQQAKLMAAAPYLLDFCTVCLTDEGAVAMRNISFAKKRLKVITEAARGMITKILGPQ